LLEIGRLIAALKRCATHRRLGSHSVAKEKDYEQECPSYTV
jgi:hypothetical protein